jgi:2-C-methyl-D-erythritol 4-phosphate cytidylyltransferase
MKTYGVVLAGGVGARLGLDIPKQMVKVAGRTILEHTVAAMHEAPQIDELIVMITPGWEEQVAALLGDRFPKLTRILPGGSTRNETTRRVLDAIADDEGKVLLHDAVRPLVDGRIIAETVDALDHYDAVDVVIPSADTIVSVDENEVISAIPDRSRLRRGQTPQGFRLGVLRDAYELAMADDYFVATDDCGVVLRYRPDVDIKCVLGTEQNMKVTLPVDLYIADKLFQLASSEAPQLAGAELLDSLDGQVLVVFGGSYGIGAEVANIATSHGATAVAHSRSTTGVHVESPDDIERALAQAYEAHGRIDAVVLTAGLLRTGPLTECEPEQIMESVAVNYLSAIYVARAAHRYLKESQGHLVYFTSSSYTRGRENYALYSSTKAALVNLTQALSDEWADDSIRVNAINPERTRTPMRESAFGKEQEDTLLTPDAVARTTLELIASDMTGHVIDVRKGDTPR